MTYFSISYSFWWVFICLIVGGGYAWVQYTKSAPWSDTVNYLLAFFRAFLVSGICFLFLEPIVQTITNYFEKPLMVIAVDDSESIAINYTSGERVELKNKIASISNELIKRGYDVQMVDLANKPIEKIDSLKFTNSLTNLSGQLAGIKGVYKEYNLSGIVLFSDGIFNAGYSPLAVSGTIPIYTVGLGDTTSIKDLSIKEVLHNSTVYEGNKLQLEVQVLNNGMGHVSSEIKVFNKEKEIASQKISFTDNQTLVKPTFSITASGSGKQSLSIRLVPVEGEYTNLNNHSTIYFDVINARKRVLILADAPHPDIKAIKTSIEQNEYYEVDLAYELPQKLDYELIILHQFPSARSTEVDKRRLFETTIPKWVIVGPATDLNYLKNKLGVLDNYNPSGKLDAVRPIWDSDFQGFTMEEGFSEWVSNLPPVSMPYGLSFNMINTQIVLFKQIGSVVTKDPLLFYTRTNEQRIGLLAGTGIWRWKLDEFRNEQSHKNFDELISKTVQYLSSDISKRRFYVSTQKKNYEQGEEVVFNTEEYNALFERVVGNKVNLSLKNEIGEKHNYNYVPLSENSTYKIGNLQEGVYTYSAFTEIDSVKYNSSGQFVVRKLNKEALNPVADYDLLKKLANKSGGAFYPYSNADEFVKYIDEFDPVSTIHSFEKEKPLSTIKWVLALLLVLASTEWFLRKFYGGY